MSSMKRTLRGAAALLLLSPLAGCGFPPPQTPEDRVALTTCRSEADRVYGVQNRAQLSERNSIDTPFSAGSQPGQPSDGLADRYSQEQMIDDCLRHGPDARLPGSPAP